jgi:gas vesicle protein
VKEVKMADGDRGSGFAIGLIVGAVLGLAIGFLFAPRSGAETRQLLKEKAETARERAAEFTRRVRETAGEAVKKAQTKIQEA